MDMDRVDNEEERPLQNQQGCSAQAAIIVDFTVNCADVTVKTGPVWRSKRVRTSMPPSFVPPSSTGSKKTKPEKKTHEDYCFSCADGGLLIECDSCPKVYHLSCLGLKAAPRSTSRWVCPWHSCLYCDKLARACPDHVLYRCRQCPYSYCKDCIPVGKKPQLDPPTDRDSSLEESFRKHHFPVPQDVRWIICPECSIEQRAVGLEATFKDSKRMLRLRLRDEEQFLTLRRTNNFASLKLCTPVELLLQICDQYWEEAMKNKNNSLLA